MILRYLGIYVKWFFVVEDEQVYQGNKAVYMQVEPGGPPVSGLGLLQGRSNI